MNTLRTLVVILACLVAPRLSLAQSSAPTDRQLVERVIQRYFDAWAVGDTAMFNRAMHESLHLKRSLDGKFADMTRQVYVGGTRPHPRDSTLQTRIVSVDIVGNIASARTEISIGQSTFVDFFNLLKLDDGWVIVDKVATRVPRGTAPEPMAPPVKDTVLDGLRRPWAMAFLSADEALISEKEGDLLRVNLTTRVRTPVAGFPADGAPSVNFGDNTGKFDVVLDPEFASNRLVYVSYAARAAGGAATKVIRARLVNDSLEQVRTVFLAEPFTSERVHYGGGMVFGPDGKLYLTVGERLFNERDETAWPIAQTRSDRRGKIYRLNPDGSIPADNPDFGAGAVRGLYATGIRASQGLTVHPVDGSTVAGAEELFAHARERIREVVQSPTGALYLLTDDTNGKLIRVRPRAP
jgi:aldose sugar dehydrogenase